MHSMSITICFIGDIMLGRYINEKMDPTLNTFISKLTRIDNAGYSDNAMKIIYGQTYKIINKCDLLVGNLESCITNRMDREKKAFNFRIHPKYSRALKIHKNMFLNVANNHIMDYQIEGMYDTLNDLDKLDIKYSGAGKNIQEAIKPVIMDIGGIKIGIIGCADHYDYWGATNNKPGIYYVDYNNYGHILNHIKETKRNVDILIMSIHWGWNFIKGIDNKYQKFARDVFDAGVNIIHGQSSHHVKCIRYNNTHMVMYGIGDFVNDYTVNDAYRSNLGVIVKVSTDGKSIQRVSIHPTEVDDGKVTILHPGKERDYICDIVKDDCDIQPMDASYLSPECT